VSVLETVDVEIGLRWTRFQAGLKSASELTDRFEAATRKKLESAEVPAPKVGPGPAAASGQAAAVADQFAAIGPSLAGSLMPLLGQLKSAIGVAVQPLTQFAARFSAQFDKVGGALVELAKRVDDYMKFPGFEKRVNNLRSFIRRKFGLIETDAKAVGASIASVAPDFGPMVLSFENAERRIKAAVAPIPKDVGYALLAAEHTDHKAAFPQFLAGLDTVKSEAVEKLKALAAAADAPARGKGSRKAKWARRDAAADLKATHDAAPSRDNTTAATTLPRDPMAGVRKAMAVAQASFETTARLGARAADMTLGAWLKFEKARHVFSTFGSVAKKTMGAVAAIRPPKFKFDLSQSTVINNISQATQSATGSMKAFGGQVAIALGAFGLAFKSVAFIKDGIKGASDLAETISKTDAVLGQASTGVKAFADEYASKFGVIKQETLDVASGLGGLGKGLGGLGGAELEKFTVKYTKLAADLSSFKNISFGDAGKALQVALSGNQSDELKALGVVTTEATVKSYALSHGIAKVGEELTEQQKIMARAGVISEALKDADGDLDRTSGGTANQFRKFTGTITNLGTAIGEMLLPAVNKGLGLLNQFGTYAISAFEGSKESIAAFGEKISTAFDYIGAATTNWKSTFEVARLYIAQGLTNIGEYLNVLGPNFGVVAEYAAKNWKELFTDAFNATIAGLKNLWANFKAIGAGIFEFFKNPTKDFHVEWTPLLDGFEATAAKFPELIKPHLTDMAKEIARAAQPIIDDVARRAARAKAAATAVQASAGKAGELDAKAAAKAQSDIAKFAEKLKDKTATPLEEYREQVAKIGEAFGKNLIDEKTGQRGLAEARKKLEGDGPQFAGAATAGSADARSAILAAVSGRGGGDELTKDSRLMVRQGDRQIGLMEQIARTLSETKSAEVPLR